MCLYHACVVVGGNPGQLTLELVYQEAITTTQNGYFMKTCSIQIYYALHPKNCRCSSNSNSDEQLVKPTGRREELMVETEYHSRGCDLSFPLPLTKR